MIRNNIAIDYLRAFITMLVLAHHSIIAYSNLPVYAIKSFAASSSIAPSATMAFISKPYLWSAFPVVDGQHWQGFDVLILFNDIFFMSLMFFLAGLFVWPSIARKGGRGYLYGRIRRLGLPFLLAAAFLSPLAYYPSYLLSGADPAAGAYFQQWFSLDYWPPGPCWFVAVLLGFDIVATILIKFFPGWIKKLGELCSGATHRPTRFFFGLIGISIVAYATMRLPFGANRWFTVGPLALQASRAFLYPTYFFAGLGVGVWGIERGLLARDGELQRRWPVWLGATVFAFVLCVFFVIQVVALGSAASFGLQGMSSVDWRRGGWGWRRGAGNCWRSTQEA